MLLDEHVPPDLGLIFRGLRHETLHVTETDLRGRDNGELVRNLDSVNCEWLVTLDLHSQPEV